MACYPCTLCNKCGDYDALYLAALSCPACGAPFSCGAGECGACGFGLPLRPGVSAEDDRPTGVGRRGEPA